MFMTICVRRNRFLYCNISPHGISLDIVSLRTIHYKSSYRDKASDLPTKSASPRQLNETKIQDEVHAADAQLN